MALNGRKTTRLPPTIQVWVQARSSLFASPSPFTSRPAGLERSRLQGTQRVLDDVLTAIEDLLPGTPPPDVEVHQGAVTLSGQADVLTAHIIETLVDTVPGVTRVTVIDRAR